MSNAAPRSLVRLLCVVVGVLVLTIAPSASFADDIPTPPGDVTSTDGDDSEVEGGGSEGGHEDEGDGNGVVTGEPDAAGDVDEVEGGGAESVGGDGKDAVGGVHDIEARESDEVLTGILTFTADESGDVEYEVRRSIDERSSVGSQATVSVRVQNADDETDDPEVSDQDADDTAEAALPETGASNSLRPVLAAGIYFTLAGLVVVGATRRHEILVPSPAVRRRPSVNWE